MAKVNATIFRMTDIQFTSLDANNVYSLQYSTPSGNFIVLCVRQHFTA